MLMIVVRTPDGGTNSSGSGRPHTANERSHASRRAPVCFVGGSGNRSLQSHDERTARFNHDQQVEVTTRPRGWPRSGYQSAPPHTTARAVTAYHFDSRNCIRVEYAGAVHSNPASMSVQPRRCLHYRLCYCHRRYRITRTSGASCGSDGVYQWWQAE